MAKAGAVLQAGAGGKSAAFARLATELAVHVMAALDGELALPSPAAKGGR